MSSWLDRHIARWENAKINAWTPHRVERCQVAILVLKSAQAYLLGEAETPLPSEYDPEKWTSQTTRQA